MQWWGLKLFWFQTGFSEGMSCPLSWNLSDKKGNKDAKSWGEREEHSKQMEQP